MGEYVGLPAEQIIVGGDGADEILDTLAKTFIEEGLV